jgi:hypothetical protein
VTASLAKPQVSPTGKTVRRDHGLRSTEVHSGRGVTPGAWLSRDPEFVAKLRDTIVFYVDPPAHAIVLSVNEKHQIQARDRTQPGLPLKPGGWADKDP